MYHSFCKRFEKLFDLKSDGHIQVYLGNQIEHDSVEGTVTVDQERLHSTTMKKVCNMICGKGRVRSSNPGPWDTKRSAMTTALHAR
jgi:hypothetical protein